MAHGNEPGGPDRNLVLHDWLLHARHIDPTRLYTCAAGWPALPGNDYHCLMSSAGGTTYVNEGSAGSRPCLESGIGRRFDQARRHRIGL